MKLKQSLQGQVRVRVRGTQMGRFLSVLMARGILYENAAYEGSQLFLELPARQYREAVACAKKTGVRLRIVSKRGLPFLFFRQRRRKWTLLFVLPMVAIVFMMPHFVWSIELDGLKSISQVEMLSRLEQMGISVGMWQRKLDIEETRNQMLLAYEDLSFVSLSLEGTTLEVAVEEAVAAPEMVERTEPCDVVAAENCVIYSVVTESGTPVVRSGDVVQAGDVMIRGEVVLKDDAGNETVVPAHAAGEIYGKRIWRGEAVIEKKYEKQIFSEKARGGLRIRLGEYDAELRWPFGKEEKEAVIEEEFWRLPFGDFLSFHKLTYEAYQVEEAEYTKEEMETRLRERLERQMAEELEKGERIALEERWQVEETENGMRAVVEVVMMENIGLTVPRWEETGEE